MGFDPISLSLLAFTSLGLSGGALAAATYIGAAALTLAPVGLSLGASAYQQHQMRRAMQQLQAVSDPNGLQQILKQSIPAHRLILGRAAVGGALFFYEAKKPYIWYGILVAAHEIEAVESLLINGYTVFIDQDGFATSVPFRDGDKKYIEVSIRLGDLDQAIDPIIARDFPDMPATFRQRGHATIVIKAHYGFGADFQEKDDDHKRVYGDQGLLQPILRVKGARCFDPRVPGVSLDDETTWVWSDNAAVCFGRFLVHRWVTTSLVDRSRVDWDLLARCADICDRWEPSRLDAPFRRSTVNGVIQSTDANYDVIENLLIALEGKAVLDRGKIYPVADYRKSPVGTLHMGMLADTFEYVSEARDRELVNVVKPTFVAPDREYQEVGGPVLRRADLIATDGISRERSLRGAFVEDHRRMQRKASTLLNQSRLGRSINTGSTDEAQKWNPGDVIRVHLTGVLARANGLYELTSKDWVEGFKGFRLSLLQYDPTATDFDPQDEMDFVLDEDVLSAEAA